MKNNFPDRYEEWIASLPECSKPYYSSNIIVSKFFPLVDATSLPVKAIADLFYDGNLAKTSKLVGTFHADYALKGIYKLFLMVVNPHSLIKKSEAIYKRYYSESRLIVTENEQNRAVIQITGFPLKDIVMETSMGAYTKRGIELAGGKNVTARKTSSVVKGADIIEYVFSWD